MRNSFTQEKRILLCLILMLYPLMLLAQGGGLQGIQEATSMIQSYFDPATKLAYAIAACCGLIGAVKVFNKFNHGDPDTSRFASIWFAANIFIVVAIAILRAFLLS